MARCWRRTSLLVAIIGAFLVACGTSEPASPAESPAASGSPGSSPGPSLSDDVPPDVAVIPLQAYGERYPDEFGGLYLDDAGAAVLLFTAHLEAHRLAVTSLVPGLSVRVLPCRFNEHELRAVEDEIAGHVRQLGAQGVQVISAGVDVTRNVATLEAKSDVPGAEAMLESPYGGKLDATIYPVPGPWHNSASGPGWRLVADVQVGSRLAYSVRAATDAASWHGLWTDVDVGSQAPAVDLGREIVVAFGDGLSTSCPEIRLDGVAIDPSARLVYHRTSDPMSPRGCRLDLSAAHVFVIAIDRAALPASPFTVQLQPPGVCDECGSQAKVTVNLP